MRRHVKNVITKVRENGNYRLWIKGNPKSICHRLLGAPLPASRFAKDIFTCVLGEVLKSSFEKCVTMRAFFQYFHKVLNMFKYVYYSWTRLDTFDQYFLQMGIPFLIWNGYIENNNFFPLTLYSFIARVRANSG